MAIVSGRRDRCGGTDPDDEAGDEGDVGLWGADEEVGAGGGEGGEEGGEEDGVGGEGEELVHG
jgi:hypothetical protein